MMIMDKDDVLKSFKGHDEGVRSLGIQSMDKIFHFSNFEDVQRKFCYEV